MFCPSWEQYPTKIVATAKYFIMHHQTVSFKWNIRISLTSVFKYGFFCLSLVELHPLAWQCRREHHEICAMLMYKVRSRLLYVYIGACVVHQGLDRLLSDVQPRSHRPWPLQVKCWSRLKLLGVSVLYVEQFFTNVTHVDLFCIVVGHFLCSYLTFLIFTSFQVSIEYLFVHNFEWKSLVFPR